MAIRNEDWDTIRRVINESIENALSKLKPRGWRKALHLLREWGVLAAILGVITTLLGIVGAAWYYVFTHTEKEASFQTKTEMRLDSIDKQLLEIHGDLTKQAIINHASLPLADSKTTLPDLRATVATAIDQRV